MFGFVDPESGFGILISVKMLIMAALGGAGLLFGPLVGALILVPLEEISNSLLGGNGAGLTFVVYGAIIVIIARFLPSGLLALFKTATRRKPSPSRAAPCCLTRATSPRRSAPSRPSTMPPLPSPQGEVLGADRSQRRRQVDLLQLPDRRPQPDLRQRAFRGPGRHPPHTGASARLSASPARSRCR